MASSASLSLGVKCSAFHEYWRRDSDSRACLPLCAEGSKHQTSPGDPADRARVRGLGLIDALCEHFIFEARGAVNRLMPYNDLATKDPETTQTDRS
jgi:hypothetical protein